MLFIGHELRELFALCAALRCVLALRNLFEDLNLIKCESDFMIPMFCDSKSAISIASDGFKSNSKHYSKSLLYVNDYVKRNEVHIEKVNSSANLADVMTKFLDHNQFKVIFDSLGFS